MSPTTFPVAFAEAARHPTIAPRCPAEYGELVSGHVKLPPLIVPCPTRVCCGIEIKQILCVASNQGQGARTPVAVGRSADEYLPC